MLRHEAVLKGVRRVPYGKYTIRKLFRVPDRLTASARWLSRALLDAGAPRRGVTHCYDIPKLLESAEEVLLDHVCRPLQSNFTGLDGVKFIRCVQGILSGPRNGELVMVLVEIKSGARLSVKGDIAASCFSLSKTFGSKAVGFSEAADGTRLCCSCYGSCIAGLDDLQTVAFNRQRNCGRHGLYEKGYGTTMSTFAVGAESLFGTFVLRPHARSVPPIKRLLRCRGHRGSSGDSGAGGMGATNS